MKHWMIEFAFCPTCGHAMGSGIRHGQQRPVCPACGFVHFANPRVAVVLLLTEGDRLLLIKRGAWPEKGKWALPAGFVDLGEAPEDAAIREMKEETGLEVSIQGLLDLSFDATSKAIVLLYRARLRGGLLAADDDALDARWFTPSELPELAFESTRRMVEAWIKGELV